MTSQLPAINSLPIDILSEIFAWMAEAPSDRKYMKSAILARSLISSICVHWRSLVLELVPFWAVIRISFCRVTDDPQGTMEMIETLLQRSKGCQLMIILESSRECTEILDMLLLHVERWRVIRFNIPIVMHRYLLAAQDKLHCLQKIRLQRNGAKEDNDLLPLPYNLYENVPRLRTVDISAFPFALESTPLPWEQLRAFSASLTLEEFQRIPELATKLEDWRMAEKSSSSSTQSTVARRPLPPMRFLTNLFIRSKSVWGFDLSYLPPLPALESISLESRSHPHVSYWLQSEAFLELITKLSSQLRSFSYTSMENCSALPSMLGIALKLTKLTLRSSFFFPSRGIATLFRSLIAPNSGFDTSPGKECLLPKLEDINFQFLREFPERELLAMVASRYFTDSEGRRVDSVSGISCLRNVELAFYQLRAERRASAHCHARIVVLRSQGLNISLSIEAQKYDVDTPLPLPDSSVDDIFLGDSFFSTLEV